MWVSGWALFLHAPSDLGYEDDGYDLPELLTNWHRIAVDQTRAWDQTDNRGQHRLFLDAAAGVREATAEKRETLPERIEAMLEILDSGPDEQWVIWCHLNREQDEVERVLKAQGVSFSSIYGAWTSKRLRNACTSGSARKPAS